MGFNLGAFARGAARGIPEGSRIASEQSQRYSEYQAQQERDRLTEQRELFKSVVGDLYGPQANTSMPQGGESLGPRAQSAIPDQLQQTFNAANVGPAAATTTAIPTTPDTKQSWFDSKLEAITKAGLDPNYLNQAVATLQGAAQMRIRGLGGDLQMAIMNKNPELANQIANEISNLTPGDREDVSLPYKDGSYVNPETGEPVGEAGAMAYVQNFLGNLNESFEAKMKGEEIGLAKRRTAATESRAETARTLSVKQGEYYDALGIAAQARAEADLVKAYEKAAAAAGGVYGLDGPQMERILGRIEDEFLNNDSLPKAGEESYNEIKGIMLDVMAANDQYFKLPASTAAAVAQDILRASSDEENPLVLEMTTSGLAEYMLGDQPIYVNPTSLRAFLGSHIKYVDDRPDGTPAGGEAIPTGGQADFSGIDIGQAQRLGIIPTPTLPEEPFGIGMSHR